MGGVAQVSRVQPAAGTLGKRRGGWQMGFLPYQRLLVDLRLVMAFAAIRGVEARPRSACSHAPGEAGNVDMSPTLRLELDPAAGKASGHIRQRVRTP